MRAIDTVSAAEKYFWPSPPVNQTSSAMAASDTAPDTSAITTGTPERGEILPKTRGPAPSRQAAAWARPAPMIHAEPLASSAHTNIQAAALPSHSPDPERTTEPSGATLPPYTVKTVFIASTRPWRDVTCFAGKTTSTAAIGIPYISAWLTPARAIATGMSLSLIHISEPTRR